MTVTEYLAERDERLKEVDVSLISATDIFTRFLVESNYTKNHTWMGQPIIQYPTDLMAMQDIIYRVRPDYIIETGIAYGGMLLFYAGLCEAMDHGYVIGIDNEIRPHNYEAINSNYLRKRISLIEGDSGSWTTEEEVRMIMGMGIGKEHKVIVTLDSNHTHDHVLRELELYSPLVSVGSYIVVFDTAINFYGDLDANQDRPWNKNRNPYTAVQEFLKSDKGKDFGVDEQIEKQVLITAAMGGFLRRVK